jgi:hypothetical protein
MELTAKEIAVYEGCCALCKFFDPAFSRVNRPEGQEDWRDDDGWCLRYPPVFIGGLEKDMDTDPCGCDRFKQPGVHGGDRCGEYVYASEKAAIILLQRNGYKVEKLINNS